MNLQDQVTSLELSKKLLTLGVKQDSLFVWISIIKTGFNFIKIRESFEPNSKEVGAYSYSAFTVAELYELLPASVCISFISGNLKKVNKKYDLIILGYRNEVMYTELKSNRDLGDSIMGLDFIIDDILVNHLARMLIYLLENKLMELKNE